MGKNRHARRKPHIKYQKEKIKQNIVLYKNDEKNENHLHRKKEKEEKKTNFWIGWLNFFRKLKILRSNKKKKSGTDLLTQSVCSSKKTEDLNDFNFSSNESRTDIIEIPIEPGPKISKILIKPAKNGIKAMIAEYEGAPLVPIKVEETFFLTKNDFVKMEQPQKVEKMITTGTCVEDKMELVECEVIKKGNISNKNSLTSALYVRQDLDKVVESAICMEPELSNNYLGSKVSNEFCKKSININKSHLSYKMLEEENNHRQKTFKTMSEPTWNEKKKIFHHQKLQENVNELLEQFILLENDDLLSFAPSQHRKPQDSKTSMKSLVGSALSFAGNTKETLTKELSRKVSPEILVNIKPFKEPLSSSLVNVPKNPIAVLSKKFKSNKENQILHSSNTTEIDKSKNNLKETKRNLCVNFPDMAKGDGVVENDKDKETSENQSKIVKDSKLSVGTTESENENDINEKISCFLWNCGLKTFRDQSSKMFFGGTSREGSSELCAVWGVYKTYSENEIFDLTAEKTSLDDFWEGFDDTDHATIFKKNIMQFRRKISSNSLSDNKTTDTTVEVVKIQSKTFIKKEVEDFENSQELVPKASGEKKNANEKCFGHIIIENVNLNKGHCTLQKVLESHSLLLSEMRWVCKMMAMRIENAPIRTMPSKPIREIRNLIEENPFIVFKEEVPKKYVQKYEVLSQPKIKTNYESKSLSFDPLTDFLVIGEKRKILSKIFGEDSNEEEEDEDKEGEMKETLSFANPPFFANPMECFFVLENYILANVDSKNKTNKALDGTPLSVTISCAEEIETITNQTDDSNIYLNARKKSTMGFEYYLKSQKVTQIMNVEYKFPVRMGNNKFVPLFEKNAKCSSDSELLKKLLRKTNPSSSICQIFDSKTTESDDKDLSSTSTASSCSFTLNKPKMLLGGVFAKANNKTNTREEKKLPGASLWKNMDAAFSVNEKSGSKPLFHRINSDSIDGFHILYDGMDIDSLDLETLKWDSPKKQIANKNLTRKTASIVIKSERKKTKYECDLVSVPYKFVVWPEPVVENQEGHIKFEKETEQLSQLNISISQEKISMAKFLKFKSYSFPIENVVQTEYVSQDYRWSRSLNLTKEMEKFDVHGNKKKKLTSNKGFEVRKVESDLLVFGATKTQTNESECKIPNAEKFTNITEKKNLNPKVMKTVKKKKKSLMEMKDIRHLEANTEGSKMFILDKNGVNVRKEVVAAFNSIKHLTCKEEMKGGNQKRMSLVIMLSKNKTL